MDKPGLRQLYKQKRLQLTAVEKQQLELRMFGHFQQYPWPPVEELFTYIPFQKLNEPDPSVFCRHLQVTAMMYSGRQCRISVPVINNEAHTMNAVAAAEDASYNDNSFGISEPSGGTIIQPAQIDMVIVPLLAFNRNGHRVGYGKGYYDHFLKNCRKDAVLAGLSFFPPEAHIEGIFEIDVPLTHCITPEQIYVF